MGCWVDCCQEVLRSTRERERERKQSKQVKNQTTKRGQVQKTKRRTERTSGWLAGCFAVATLVVVASQVTGALAAFLRQIIEARLFPWLGLVLVRSPVLLVGVCRSVRGGLCGTSGLDPPFHSDPFAYTAQGRVKRDRRSRFGAFLHSFSCARTRVCVPEGRKRLICRLRFPLLDLLQKETKAKALTEVWRGGLSGRTVPLSRPI